MKYDKTDYKLFTVTEHQKHVGRFDTLVSMQIVDIQCRPIIYSTCVRLSVHTYTPIYTTILSPPPSHVDHNLMHPSCPSERDTAQSFPSFLQKVTEKTFLRRSYSSLCSHLSIVWRGWWGGELLWEERAWKWTWESSRKPSWVLPWPGKEKWIL